MSKSQLRRLEITNPELIAEIREQIAQGIEAKCKYNTPISRLVVDINGDRFPICCCEQAAAIARRKDDESSS